MITELNQLRRQTQAKLPAVTVGSHPYDIGYWAREAGFPQPEGIAPAIEGWLERDAEMFEGRAAATGSPYQRSGSQWVKRQHEEFKREAFPDAVALAQFQTGPTAQAASRRIEFMDSVEQSVRSRGLSSVAALLAWTVLMWAGASRFSLIWFLGSWAFGWIVSMLAISRRERHERNWRQSYALALWRMTRNLSSWRP